MSSTVCQTPASGMDRSGDHTVVIWLLFVAVSVYWLVSYLRWGRARLHRLRGAVAGLEAGAAKGP